MSTRTNKRKRQKTSSTSSLAKKRDDSNSSIIAVEESSPNKSKSVLQLSWPKNNPCTNKQFPAGGLLHNLDQYIWNALAHVDPQLIKEISNTGGKGGKQKVKGKQRAIREALNKIGIGWVAINTNPYRPVYGAMFDDAEAIYRRNGWNTPKSPLPQLTKIEVEDREWKSSSDTIELELDGIMKNGWTNDQCIFSNQLSDSIISSIDKMGMAVLPNAVDKSTIKKLLSAVASKESHPDAIMIKEQPKTVTRPVTLAYTKGDGKEGYYNGIQDNSYINRLQDVIISSLKGIEQTMNTTSEKRKYIILKYKKGGENWAHRDGGNSDQYFPYQALLMLSNNSAADYDGGEFYVATKRNDTNKTAAFYYSNVQSTVRRGGYSNLSSE